jgi:hypothetical protein
MHASVVTCSHCRKLMAVLLETSDVAAPHPYVFACPWCGRLVRQPMSGVLMRVLRASSANADDG